MGDFLNRAEQHARQRIETLRNAGIEYPAFSDMRADMRAAFLDQSAEILTREAIDRGAAA